MASSAALLPRRVARGLRFPHGRVVRLDAPMSAVARVMTELALDRVFDYAVPATLAPVLRPGHRVRVPFGGREVVGYVIELADRSELPDLKPIRACLDTEPLVTPTLLDLARWLAGYYLCPLETALRTVLPAAVRHEDASARWHRFIHITRPPTEDEARQLALRGGRRAALLEALKAAGPITVADAKRRLGATPALLKGLEGMELIRLDESEVPRDPFEGATFLPSEPLALNLSQAAALASVTAALHEPSPLPILLHGVTGSGKTEIYLQAIAASLDLGRGAIVLVPEIALTPQNVEHFKSRFARRGTGVAVLHSHLSGGERRDEWHRIRSGAAPVVIGARSAVFAPVSPLGLIVVDEEHESSYKQGEAPRYHARDVAVMRGHLERVPVVLGSATPSLESHYNACRGKYRLVSMPERIDGRAMPEVRVVDMRHEKPLVKGGPALISRRLHGAILDRLERGEQVILFLNRRGYSTSLICPACGQVATCPHCSVSLTFHRRHRKLKCHLCNHEEAPWDACPACHKDHIRHAGAGTERVELGLERLYPKARIARMDSDAMTRKGAHARLLSEFRAGRIDLLVGTQMIAKGLHFPNVTLVGVVNADLALHLPDFRAAERVFQLLTQVAGRAGRGEVPGEVFVQTHTPHHPAIQFARRHDFPGFYEHEIAFREQLGYPPVRRALLVGIRSRSNETAAFVAASLAKALKARLPASALVTGPAPAPIEKIQDHYRHQIFIRGVPARGLAALFRELRSTHEGETVSLTVDVDPLSLL